MSAIKNNAQLLAHSIAMALCSPLRSVFWCARWCDCKLCTTGCWLPERCHWAKCPKYWSSKSQSSPVQWISSSHARMLYSSSILVHRPTYMTKIQTPIICCITSIAYGLHISNISKLHSFIRIIHDKLLNYVTRPIHNLAVAPCYGYGYVHRSVVLSSVIESKQTVSQVTYDYHAAEHMSFTMWRVFIYI